MSKVLIIEDELSILKMLEYDMKKEGFEVSVASTGNEGYVMALENKFDVILLDLMLPGMDGMTICSKLREHNVDSFIIMLTAMNDESYKVDGLNRGADDYVTKPFSTNEVIARIHSKLRRKDVQKKEQILKYKNIIINQEKYQVTIDGILIDFTLKEYELLVYLIKNKGKVLSRDLLLNNLWGYSYDGDTRVVDVHIFKVREKAQFDQRTLKTIRGVGYMLIEE